MIQQVPENASSSKVSAEDYIPIDQDDTNNINNNSMMMMMNDGGEEDSSRKSSNNMEFEETTTTTLAVGNNTSSNSSNSTFATEKKIPKALIELKKIFPDEFDFELLKSQYGRATTGNESSLHENIEKVIVKEGTGLEATPISIIRYMEACKVFFKRTECSDWEAITHSNTMLQENRLKLTKVPPVFLNCIHSMKLGECAYFKIHKDLYPELKVTRLDPIQDNVETEKLLDLLDCFDYYGVQYITITYMEVKELPPPMVSFESYLESINRKRLEGNVLFKEFSFSKALKAYNSGIIVVNEAKLDEDKIDEQKLKLKEERVKLLVNIAKCHTSLNNEKNHKLCLDTCDKILYFDPENYNAYYLKAKTYNILDDYSRGLECLEKAKQYFEQYQQKTNIDQEQQKKDSELKQRMDIVEKQLLRKKKLQEEEDNKVMKSKMSNMFSEELYADTEPFDEEEMWRRQQEEDERLGRKPWFMSDGTIHYQEL